MPSEPSGTGGMDEEGSAAPGAAGIRGNAGKVVWPVGAVVSPVWCEVRHPQLCPTSLNPAHDPVNYVPRP